MLLIEDVGVDLGGSSGFERGCDDVFVSFADNEVVVDGLVKLVMVIVVAMLSLFFLLLMLVVMIVLVAGAVEKKYMMLLLLLLRWCRRRHFFRTPAASLQLFAVLTVSAVSSCHSCSCWFRGEFQCSLKKLHGLRHKFKILNSEWCRKRGPWRRDF